MRPTCVECGRWIESGVFCSDDCQADYLRHDSLTIRDGEGGDTYYVWRREGRAVQYHAGRGKIRPPLDKP